MRKNAPKVDKLHKKYKKTRAYLRMWKKCCNFARFFEN